MNARECAFLDRVKNWLKSHWIAASAALAMIATAVGMGTERLQLSVTWLWESSTRASR